MAAAALTPEATAYVEGLAGRLGELLGGSLRSVVLVGSGALGGFDADRSDIDLQAVVGDRLPVATRRRIAADLLPDALRCPARGLELVVYSAHGLLDPRGPAYEINLNAGPRMERHVSVDPEEDPRFWFVLDVAIAHDRGLAIAGRPPGEVFPALPPGLVLQALDDALAWYAADERPRAELLLAAGRAWAWAADRRWRSKEDSARWAAERLNGPGMEGTADVVEAARAAIRAAQRSLP